MITAWLLREDRPIALEHVPRGVEYHRVLAGDRRRVPRGLLAIALLLAGMVGFSVALGAVAAVIDQQLGRTSFTPLTQAAGALSLALLIPWSMLLQRWLYGVRGASLHSVAGRLRFGLIGRTLLAVGPLWFLVVAVGFLVPGEQVAWSYADLLAMLVVSVLLTPLQAAGEEYGFRGLMLRVVGGWTRNPTTGLVLAVVLTAVVFTALHGTFDPYMAAWYLVLFGTLAVLTWRTGGLEVAVVLHAVLNSATFVAATVLQLDVGGALDARGETAGGLSNLVPAAALLLITAAIWWSTRRSGPVTTPTPTPEGDPA